MKEPARQALSGFSVRLQTATALFLERNGRELKVFEVAKGHFHDRKIRSGTAGQERGRSQAWHPTRQGQGRRVGQWLEGQYPGVGPGEQHPGVQRITGRMKEG